VESERLSGVYGRYEAERHKSRVWSLENPGSAAIRAALLEKVLAAGDRELHSGAEILDLGCGSGWWLEVFHEQGVAAGRLHGIDAIEDRIGRARQRLSESDLRVGDIRKLPYEDDGFGLVLIVSVLSDLPTEEDVDSALREAVRVLAPGGLLLCYEPRMPNPLNRNVRRITEGSFDRALGERWRGTPLTFLPPVTYRLGSLAPRLYPVLSRIRPLLSHRLVEYRKAAGSAAI
jgi:ubiquinone/menaquinone biosynthesis C-methylase UbiE